MADIFDQATELEELHRAKAIEYRKPILSPKGYCYNCADEVEDNKLFCSLECRDDFQLIEASKERNGK